MVTKRSHKPCTNLHKPAAEDDDDDDNDDDDDDDDNELFLWYG